MHPIVEREPLFHLEEGVTSEGYPLVAIYGEQGPRVPRSYACYNPA
jgi:hypothetical protein